MIVFQGYSEEDRKALTNIIHNNIFVAMSSMCSAMRTLNINYSNNDNHVSIVLVLTFLIGRNPGNLDVFELLWPLQENAELIKGVNAANDTSVRLEDRHVAAIKSLWEDSGIKEAYDRRREYQLPDSCL